MTVKLGTAESKKRQKAWTLPFLVDINSLLLAEVFTSASDLEEDLCVDALEISFDEMLIALRALIVDYPYIRELNLKLRKITETHYLVCQSSATNRWADLHADGTCVFYRTALLRAIQTAGGKELQFYFREYTLSSGRRQYGTSKV
jgi:hypothetical protein